MDMKTGVGAALLASVAFIGITVYSGMFVLDQTERGYITRLGKVQGTILEPGVHFKLPFVEHVDIMTISRDSFHVDNLRIVTKDNQMVTFDFTVLYETPDDAVYSLLYNLGKSGNVDIKSNVISMVRDRVGRIISPRNAIDIASNREAITNQIVEELRKEVFSVYKLSIIDVQMSKMDFDDRFLESVKAAANEKAEAQRQQNIVAQKEAKAQQQIAEAHGEAESAAIKAEGAKRSAIAKAEGEAAAVSLVTKAQNDALRVQAEIINSNPHMIEYEWARHSVGNVPGTVITGGETTPVLGLPSLTAIK